MTGGAARARVLVLDVDGVIVHSDPEHRAAFATALETRWDIDRAHFQEHFLGRHGDDLIRGRCHVRDLLPVFLTECGVLQCDDPTRAVETFLHDWFLGRTPVADPAVLVRVARVRARGVPVHLGTNQDLLRAEHLWVTAGLSDHFDAMHDSAHLGAAKPEAAYFVAAQVAASQLCGTLTASDILFLDDKRENVDAAIAHGWRAAVYETIDDLDRALAAHGLAERTRIGA